MRPWEEFVTAEERKRYQKAGYGSRQIQLGRKPALMIIDVTEGFVAKPSGENEKFATACPDASEAVESIAKLLEKARQLGLPVVYTTGDAAASKFYGGATKRPRSEADNDPRRDQIIKEIAPLPEEYLHKKNKASAFFGTQLADYLYNRGVDTILVTGTATSGCVRASVVDAFSHGFKVIVVEEAVFDRAPTLHMANMFDMNAKYADVLQLATVLGLLSKDISF